MRLCIIELGVKIKFSNCLLSILVGPNSHFFVYYI